MRTAGALPARKVDAIVGQHDERIAISKLPYADDVNGRMAVADEPWRGRRECDDAGEAAPGPSRIRCRAMC
jgi:hypothetical protein